MPDLFETWFELKRNTRIRTAMWADAGAPDEFPYIENVPSLAESASPFMASYRAAGRGERQEALQLIKMQLQDDGISLNKIPQVPESRWKKKPPKGTAKIGWIPGAMPKREDG